MGGRFGDAGAGDVARAGQATGAAARRAWASGPRGFTLLELMITLSVTTIGLIGLLSLHLSIVRGNDGASRSAEAQQITVNRLESLRAQRFDALMQMFTGTPPPNPPPGPLPTPKRTWVVPGRANMSYTVTAWVDAPPGASPSLLKIRVETTWTEDGGTPGKNPMLDHKLALEVIRTLEDAP